MSGKIGGNEDKKTGGAGKRGGKNPRRPKLGLQKQIPKVTVSRRIMLR